MLTAIREGSKGWISGIVIGLIVLTFALWGIGSYLEGGSQIPVASVNGEEIDAYTYQNQLSRQRQALISQFGSSLSPEMMRTLGLQQQVLDSLIESQLLGQYTLERNYRLTDEEVARRVRENEAFLIDGRFDPALYERLLASSGMSPQGYEAAERQGGMVQQLADAIAGSAFVVEPEVSRLIALQHQSRDAQYAVIRGDLYVDEFAVSDDEARAEYDANIEKYYNPARMRVEYIDLSVDELAADADPSEEEIEQTYELIRDRLKTAEVRKASHILISVNGDTDEARAAALAEAETVLSRARGGADFAELAAEFSDDTGSAGSGGDLGVVTRGQMVQPFEDAVFGMVEGELAGPVETQFGYHVIKLTELQAEQSQTLDEVREEVIAEARRAAAERMFNDLVEPFDNAIFEQPETLEPAADATGLEIMTSEWFTRHEGAGIAGEAAVRAAAFSPDVLDENLNSPAVELGFDRLVALRKLNHEESSPREFEEVADEIIAAIKLEKSRAKAAQVAKESVADLTHLASWDIMLAKNEWRAETLPATRDRIFPGLAQLGDSVFTAALPRDGWPVYGHTVLANGDAAVYALTAVTPGKAETVDADVKSGLEQQLVYRDGEEVYHSFIQTLRSAADIKINEEQLEQL
ncbi:MAG: SurA N-terminal domain-containing protein [Gammaproteobacteria bacterium]|nr:SurA N-terminal domain-containing protein [Gammaproteobacteria bacterium]